ncbi:Proline/betaine transporter [Cardinium endosymbiont of Culicoides punctatus]|nr:Proline/betaine transporter [Cardinium endosymbiont of Culicoides punctatus]
MSTSQRKTILIANAFIHFDNAIYGYLVPIIAPVFFPDKHIVIQLVLGYGLFMTSFLAKPFGILFFSRIAEDKQESVALRYTLVGVGMGLIAIGLLPSNKEATWWSVILLMLCRICIEACSAGEHHIARLYLLKDASTQQAKGASIAYQVSTMVGILLAGGVGTIFALIHDSAQYWHLPFVIAGVLTLLNLIIFRLYVTDLNVQSTAVYKIDTKTSYVLFLKFWKERIAIIRIAIVTGFSYVTYTVPFLFMNSFVPLVTGISYASMMQHVTIFMVLDVVLLIWMGSICRKYDHNNLMAVSSLFIGLSIMPLFYWLRGASMLYVMFVRCWLIFFGVIFSCFITLWAKEQVSKTTPYITIGFATVLGSTLLGKSATSICLYLFHWSNNPIAPACYIAILAIIASMIMADSASE